MPSERSLYDKAELRSRCRRYRSALDEARYASLSDSIVRRALSSGVFDAFRLIHVYWPIIEHYEIDTRPLIATLQETGKQVVIPAIDPNADRAAGRMICRAFTGVENLRKNAWGTYEPAAGEPVPPGRIELVVAPALGADRSGFRLGHGGGFYDRFLKETDCPALSLVYSECLFDSVPHDPHDVKVDLIVTEDELVSPGNLQPRSLPDRN
ncbi:MAG TPA: 5-formyltetrahydrofolate cyclo-ligase [Rhodothermales bacterium]|nr:5-formyltetrahydrofolate cyclo-ligase [Rhodothermales bacterium]